jgi:hypothetical protein
LQRFTGSLSIRPFDFSKDSRIRTAPTAPTSPLEWAEAEATIVHPSRGRIAFDPYPYQRAMLDSYHAPRRIVLKARQVGFSQTIALEALYAAIHTPESMILLVSRSQDLAINLLRYCYQAYANLRAAPPLSKQNESEMGFTNGSRIKSIPANRSTGRGFAASRVYLDEFAYADYADDIYQSISPSLSQGGALTIGSTPNGTQNLFHGLYVTGEGFSRLSVPWHHCPAYYTAEERAAGVPPEQSAWYLSQRPNYTTQQWASEFDCDFVGSGEAVFSSSAIEGAEHGAVGTIPAVPGHRYLIAVDVGRRQDATVINAIDLNTHPYQRVYHERIERAPYPLLQQRIELAARSYAGILVVESNGVGDPVIENLAVRAQPFTTTARSKVQAIQSLALLLEHGRLKARWTAQERRELLGYMYDDARLTQDCVMSLAIGAMSIAQMGTPGI